MSTIAVTGASGQLGQQFNFMSQFYPLHDFIFFDSEEIDITIESVISKTLDEYDIDFLINCAAYTLVDQAEQEEDKAYRINADGVENLARYCHKENIILIHFSSDYVYHNELNRPLRETDPTTPKGVYARSKMEGERRLIAEMDNYLIFRISWLYSSYGSNFLKSIMKAAHGRDSLQIVYDQIGSPTYARDIASKSLRVVDGLAEGLFDIKSTAGIYNVANAGVASWYDFGLQIFERANIKLKVDPILSAEYKTAAVRPTYSVFDQSKFNDTFGFSLNHWLRGLDKCFKALNED